MARVSDVREVRHLMEISLDGVVWLRITKKHYALRPLSVGEDVDAEEYLDSLCALQAGDCYEAALCILDHADQAGGALVRKLTAKGYVRPAAEAAVMRLKENRIIDDGRYAQRMAQSQLHRPVGAYQVKQKLRAKHLSEEAIEAAMAGFDDEQQISACREAAQKLWRKYAALPAREGKAKLSQALARRGFGWEMIRIAVDEITSGWDADDF